MYRGGSAPKDPLARFLGRIDTSSTDCWLWTGALTRGGYAQFSVNGRLVFVHRWSYEHFVGPIPDGREIDHMCGVQRCANPLHLRPLTGAENVQAYWREQRGKCPNEHPYTPENTVWRLRGTMRCCRICERARAKRWYDKQRARSVA